MKKLLLTFFLLVAVISLLAQAPNSFNYQAVVRDSQGEVLQNQNVSLLISILQGSETGTVVYSETHSKNTNDHGLVSLKIGEGTVETDDFSNISWDNGPYFIKLELDPDGGTSYTEMGTTQLLSVPYALYAGQTKTIDHYNSDTLFVVKDYNGNVVFAVFPDGAKVFVNDTSVKGPVGGFAVSGRNSSKNLKGEYEIMKITPDSARFYVNQGAKGPVGGFAVSGRNNKKGILEDMFLTTSDSTRVYVNQTAKGPIGGFAVSGRNTGKSNNAKFLDLTSTNYLIGHESGSSLTTGNYNSFIGYQAGKGVTTGDHNIFIGYMSGFMNTTGYDNIFIGDSSGYANDKGYNNIFIGNKAGQENIDGEYNVVLGNSAGLKNNGNYNVFIGYESGYNNVSGSDPRYSKWNTFIGYQSGKGNVTGWQNIAIGYQAGLKNDSATNQFFIGNSAGQNLTSGYGNSFIGHGSGVNSVDVMNNTFVGYYAGNDNIYGNNNTLLGYAAGKKMKGSDNTYIGYMSGYNNINGSGNVFIGSGAGFNETGSEKLYIDNSSTSQPLIWGDFLNDNVVINGNSDDNTEGYDFYVNGRAGGDYTWNSLSDKKLKKNIFTISNALGKVLKMRGVQFNWKDHSKVAKKQIGFIAQEVKNILPEVVNSSGEFHSMQYAPITAILVEAVKEQQQSIKKQEKIIKELLKRIEKLEKNIE